MIRVTKTLYTETAHIVRNAVSERCAFNIHGHSYEWNIDIEGPVQENGMVRDFGDFKSLKQIVDLFDHSTILWSREDSKIIDFFMSNFRRVILMPENPTAENMAIWLRKKISEFLEKQGKCDKLCAGASVRETKSGLAIAECLDVESINRGSSEHVLWLSPELYREGARAFPDFLSRGHFQEFAL